MKSVLFYEILELGEIVIVALQSSVE